MKRITVLLAEDHGIVREGLRSLLELCGDFEVVGEASTGRQAVELARKLRPAIVVMDIAMPLLNGFEATRQILAAAPETKVLVLSAHSDDEYVAHMARMMQLLGDDSVTAKKKSATNAAAATARCAGVFRARLPIRTIASITTASTAAFSPKNSACTGPTEPKAA